MKVFSLTDQKTWIRLALAFGLLSFSCALWRAQAVVLNQPPPHSPASSPAGQANPLAEALNADGTVKAGQEGSFDPSGFRLEYTATGAPRFMSVATTPDDRWDGQFTLPGLGKTVSAIVVSGNEVYVGGSFTTAGDVNANYIAKWDGANWSALGSGLNGRVTALVKSGNDLYVGGAFTAAGGIPANRIAKWNGSAWSSLGAGVNDEVVALALSGNDLYVGGVFTTAGGIPANRIAKWNGSAWTTLGSGLSNSVVALATNGTDVYAGGIFALAGGNPANRIAKWDGNSWSPLGSGLHHPIISAVRTLALSGSDLYVGGLFTVAGSTPALHIAKWNGNTWSSVGSGLNADTYTLAIQGNELYVGGTFTTAGGLPANRIAKWNGSTWTALGSGFNEAVSALFISGNHLYAGGLFTTTSGKAAARVAKWDGASWSPLGQGNGVTAPVLSFFAQGNDLYVGGAFAGAGNLEVNRIAKWNGQAWASFGGGVKGAASVQAVARVGNDLYVGGAFSIANGSQTDYLAKWNGTNWVTVGSGINGPVEALAVSGTDLYVTGGFNLAGGNPASGIAKWDGSNWSALGDGLSGKGNVVLVSGNDVYVGGAFTAAGNQPAINLAKWNGSAWSALGSGLNNEVYALAKRGNDLYVGGTFTTAGGVPANRIAKWDGNTWSSLSSGVEGTGSVGVAALAFNENELFVGGTFAVAGGITANNLAKWNGNTWAALGSGLDGTVISLAIFADSLYVGGDFNKAGNKPSANIARYSLLNSAPTIASINQLSQQAGATTALVPIATVKDAEDAANTLALTINGAASATVNGVTVSNLTVNAAGQVSAQIAATAEATTASFTLRVTDSAGLFAEAALRIQVVRVSATLTDPLTCTGPGNTVAVSVSAGNPGLVPLTANLTVTFSNLVGVPGSCNLPGCTVTATGLSYNATLAPGQSVTLEYLTRVADGAAPGAQVCTNNTLIFNGGQPLTVTACKAINCPAAGPGALAATTSPASDQKPGSVLIYNVYTSSATAANTQNTRLSITNTHVVNPAFVHLFFVDGASCGVADSYLCLTPNQTATFLASDLDPGTMGYVIAIATDAQGCPTNFNYLIGDEFVKFASGHAANLGAESVTAIANGLPLCDGNSVTAELRFDGLAYNVLPHVVAVDNIGARADGNDTLLLLNRLGGNLSTGAMTLSGLFGIFYDDSESPVSFSFSPGTCQFRSTLSNNFPRIVPRFEQFIPAGRSGWFKLSASGLAAMSGAVINFNPNATTTSGTFNQGHNLHKLTTTNTAIYTIPVFPPNC